MSDYQIRRDRHYDRVNNANSQLRGLIDSVGRSFDAGRITAEQALAEIRERTAKTDAAIEASWDELLGGAS